MRFEKYPPLSSTQQFTPLSDKFKIFFTINPTRLILQFPRNISWTPISSLSQFVQKEFPEWYANQIGAILSFYLQIYRLWSWIKWEQDHNRAVYRPNRETGNDLKEFGKELIAYFNIWWTLRKNVLRTLVINRRLCRYQFHLKLPPPLPLDKPPGNETGSQKPQPRDIKLENFTNISINSYTIWNKKLCDLNK